MTLKFPPYEWLKALPLKGKYEYRDRVTGKPFYGDVHKEYTGVDNLLIIDNLKRLANAQKDICG